MDATRGERPLLRHEGPTIDFKMGGEVISAGGNWLLNSTSTLPTGQVIWNPQEDFQTRLWKPPFMMDGGWIVTHPHEALDIASALGEATRGSVTIPTTLSEAVERSQYGVIREIQRGLSWPWRYQALPAPEEVVSIFRPGLERIATFGPESQELEVELQSYAEFVRRPGPVDRMLAEEFLFMKSSSTLLARNRRPFVLWRERGKSILELARSSLQRKRTFMSRFPDLRFFAGIVILAGPALGPLAPVISGAGGALLVFYDP